MRRINTMKLNWLHSGYRNPLLGTIKLLFLLAFIQLFTWLIPASSDFKGIPNYLPLHSLLETVSIVVSMMVFAVGWNSHSRTLPGNIVLLASVFFSVGLLDFSHTLAYVGMPDFISHNDSQKQLNFWLSARLLAAASLLVISLRSWQPFRASVTRYLILNSLILFTVILNWAVVYHQEWFPDTFIPGVGLTPFKKNMEYIIILINIITAVILLSKMNKPQAFNVVLLFGAVCTLAMSEFFFTLYTTMTGSYNVLGHVYKVIAYLFIYRAIVIEAIEVPYNKLAQLQESLTLSLHASNTGLWDWDLANNNVNYSPEWKAQLGYLPDDLPNRLSTWESLIHPEDREDAIKRVQNFLDSSSLQYESEFRLRHRDGSYRWIMARGEKHWDSKGKVRRLIGSHIDISEFRQAEQSLHESEIRFRNIMEHAPIGMLITAPDGHILLANQAFCNMVGYSKDELDKMSYQDITHPEDMSFPR